jgi:zinc/manganese transport system substrate-binding protein
MMDDSKRYWMAMILVCCGVLLPGVARAEKVQVVATLGDLAAAAREVGGDRVEVELLARPQEDPHFVDAKPSYVRAVASADLLILNGMSLEIGWLPTLVENSRNAKIQQGKDGYFDASTVVKRKQVPNQRITRAMGDVHPEGNPHYTMAPKQMARVALALGKRLGAIDPKHKKKYAKRARAFAKKCLLAHRRWKKKFAKVPSKRRKVVIYHMAWVYVLDWLDLQGVATIEPKPGVQPNPKHTAEVIERIEAESVPVLLKMEYYPSSIVETIAEKTGVTVITSQGQTRDGKSYIDRVDRLAGAVYRAMSKQEGDDDE